MRNFSPLHLQIKQEQAVLLLHLQLPIPTLPPMMLPASKRVAHLACHLLNHRRLSRFPSRAAPIDPCLIALSVAHDGHTALFTIEPKTLVIPTSPPIRSIILNVNAFLPVSLAQ